MNIYIAPGKYVVAVSGGVDSMALLDLLNQHNNLELIVAHFNHGIRLDSINDEELVQTTAKNYGLPVEVGYGSLGKNTSEETARRARYGFLESVKVKYSADAIITAHHQDDLIETAFINILRGTGYRGLTAITKNIKVMRPLLAFTKQELKEYAQKQHLAWNEDSTNEDLNYLRNYLRHEITPHLNSLNRQEIINNIEKVAKNDSQISEIIAKISQNIMKDGEINRAKFTLLPAEIGDELVVCWLRELGVENYDKKMVNHLSLALKTSLPNTKHDTGKRHWLLVESKTAHFTDKT